MHSRNLDPAAGALLALAPSHRSPGSHRYCRIECRRKWCLAGLVGYRLVFVAGKMESQGGRLAGVDLLVSTTSSTTGSKAKASPIFISWSGWTQKVRSGPPLVFCDRLLRNVVRGDDESKRPTYPRDSSKGNPRAESSGPDDLFKCQLESEMKKFGMCP